MSLVLARGPQSPAESARAKTAIAAAHARRVNEWSEIAAVHADVATLTPGVFSQIDAAVCGFDNARGRYLAARLLISARVPFADVGAAADHGLCRVSVAHVARGSGSDGNSETACPICPWSIEQLARTGEDLGLACAGIQLDSDAGASSTLTLGHRAATLAVRETLALCGALPRVQPSVGREIRDDLYGLRLESFRVRLEPGCAADHSLAAPAEPLGLEPDEIRLGELTSACSIHPEDTIVLAASELVETAMCVHCFATARPLRRVGSPRPPCTGCGGPMAPVRRARRVRWGDAAASMRHASASEWFAPGGDAFAVEGRDGARAYRFPAPRVAWQAGAPWSEEAARRRYERLPSDYDLDAIRRKRIAILGLGHVGAAVLQQLAPLPFAGFLLLDRDSFQERNRPSFAIPVEERT